MAIDWTKYPHLKPADVRIDTYTPAVPRGREHQGTRVVDMASGLVARGSGFNGIEFALQRLDAAVAARAQDVVLPSRATT